MELQQIIKNISADTLDEFVDSLYEEIHIPIAFFDTVGQVIAVCQQAQLCKCYHKKFGENDNTAYCQLFLPTFTSDIIKGLVVDRLCDSCTRITSHLINIGNKNYTIAIFQYLLTSDTIALDSNPNFNNSDEKEEQYNWEPVVIGLNDRAIIFEYAAKLFKNLIVDMINK